MSQSHPEMDSLADLHREHAEEFLRWLGTQTSQHTGAPLSVSFRRSVVTLITRFITETAAWEWDDVPARVLFTRADIPKINHPVPRFIPDHELAALMTAVDQLADPYQRAALIVARWSGARRDEIRRLAVDCLDAYPDGHPRLRIPVGKGYAERMIPLHPQAAGALQPVIDLARRSRLADDSIPAQADRSSTFSSCAASCCPTRSFRPVPQSRLHRSRSGRLRRPTHHHRPPLPAHHRHPARRRRCPHPDDHGRARSPNTEHVDHLLDAVRPHRQEAVPRSSRPPPSDPTSPSPGLPPTRCANTASTPKWCPGCKPTSSRPNSNSVTACAPRLRDRVSVTSFDLLEVPHHQRLRTPTTRPPGRRATTHRRRHHARLAARDRTAHGDQGPHRAAAHGPPPVLTEP